MVTGLAFFCILSVLCVEVFSAAVPKLKGTPHFSYNPKDIYGPSGWGKIWPVCNGNSQSPINIETSRATVNQSLQVQYQPIKGLLPGILSNNGHVPVFKFKPSIQKPVLTGVPHLEADDFLLEQLHLHFHSNASVGSEHTLDGKHFAGEFHLVHYNKKYGNFSNALTYPDGLAVVAVFVQDLGEETPLHVEDLVAETEETSQVGSTLCLSLNPTKFLPRSTRFYTYPGSLTTPACDESVTWIVLTTPISIPDSDMTKLRQMKDIHDNPISLYGNTRPQSPIGTRELEANFV